MGILGGSTSNSSRALEGLGVRGKLDSSFRRTTDKDRAVSVDDAALDCVNHKSDELDKSLPIPESGEVVLSMEPAGVFGLSA